MTALRHKVAAAIVGVGAVSVLATGVANAAPVHGPAPKPVPKSTPVPETNCTLGQVEKALAKEDPAAWKKINKNPQHRARFEQMVVLTKEQRKEKKAEWKRAHPTEAGIVQFLKDNNISMHSPQEKAKMKAERKATMEKVKATCSKY
ncbi:hemophore-related protein [Gordonia crocea]|uniref:Hemophore-related protein n=1 Tax=Gordonia crocea TaxID=589162 RepID=A0A7M3SV43_9ACTN|nr:hemophore-related protein [Gordonia crocea]GED96517.1 hypothetical protein nbrc107697_05560 [Gordonia crocea]